MWDIARHFWYKNDGPGIINECSGEVSLLLGKMADIHCRTRPMVKCCNSKAMNGRALVI